MELLKAYCKDFWRYRFLLYNLVGRDFKLKYRRSILGVVWSVLNPLLMNVVMVIVFSTIMDMRSGGISNFSVYLIIGQLLFNFFNEATSVAMGSVLGSATLLRKVYIPKYIFPLEKVCFSLVNCLFSFIALIIVMIFTRAPLHLTVPLALYPLLTLFVFSLGIGLVLATLAVFFRDVMHLWGVFTTALMDFSAIFYDPMGLAPSAAVSFLQRFISFNPIYWYITAFRGAVLDGRLLTGSELLVCGGCALVALAVGLVVFRKQQDKFVLHM